MKTIYSMIVRTFIPVFIGTIFFFVFVFELLDVFSNLVRYIERNISIQDIGLIALYYIPKCITYSLPIGLLFSITYSLGTFYMNNELIAIFGSGISLYRLIIPFFIFGAVFSLFMFFFEEKVAIASISVKNTLYSKALGLPEPYSDTNIAIKSVSDKYIYQANFYNDKNQTLSGVTVLERDDKNKLVRQIDAESGEWNGKYWVLKNCRIFEWNPGKTMFVEKGQQVYYNEMLTERPRIFQKLSRKIDEMEAADAYAWIMALKKAGRSYQGSLAEYYKKYSFALTPLIIVLISCSVGGILKKNVFLMSLFLSICIVVVYYVVQMVTMTFANFGIIDPFLGAWTPLILFLGIGVFMVKIART
jgi:lipopolysaccharide export system permease protein